MSAARQLVALERALRSSKERAASTQIGGHSVELHLVDNISNSRLGCRKVTQASWRLDGKRVSYSKLLAFLEPIHGC